MKKIVTAFVLSLFIGSLCAQSFEWKAAIQKPDSSGFHRILLTPEIISKLGIQLHDIRIYDDATNKEVPYVMRTEEPIQSKQLFKEYPIIEKRSEKNKFTYLVLSNEKQTKISNISLVIKNADVLKELTLSGSDNKIDWFVLKDKFTITNINNPTETSEIKILDFPLSNYTYYQVKISDKKSAPLNIIKAGYYDFNTEYGKYVEVPGATLVQTDSASEKKTYIKIKYSANYIIDRLSFSFSGTPYFLRHATLFEKQKMKVKRKKTETYYAPLASFDISSTDFNSILLSTVKANDLLLVIENEDNPPLTLQKINAYQLNRQLVAWLENEKSYTLFMGNEKVGEPVYDLGYFENKIPVQIPLLNVTLIESSQSTSQSFELSWFTQKRIIWIALTGVIILLGVMTMRLVKDMKK
jgi:hypothetical protein